MYRIRFEEKEGWNLNHESKSNIFEFSGQEHEHPERNRVMDVTKGDDVST